MKILKNKKIISKLTMIAIAFVSMIATTVVFSYAADGGGDIGSAVTTKALGAALAANMGNVKFFQWILACIGFFVMFFCGALAVKELLSKNFASGIGYGIAMIPGWYMSEWVVSIFNGAFS